MDGARESGEAAADACVLPSRVRATAVPDLSAGTSRHGARAFSGDGASSAAGLAQYRIASLTKPFTAAAVVLTLAAQGIPLSVPAVELLPSLAAGWRADPAITVGQLLGQVSGLRPVVDSSVLAAAGIGDGTGALEEAARLVVLAGSERAPAERRCPRSPASSATCSSRSPATTCPARSTRSPPDQTRWPDLARHDRGRG